MWENRRNRFKIADVVGLSKAKTKTVSLAHEVRVQGGRRFWAMKILDEDGRPILVIVRTIDSTDIRQIMQKTPSLIPFKIRRHVKGIVVPEYLQDHVISCLLLTDLPQHKGMNVLSDPLFFH
jgi:hypothetical protein